MHERWTDRLSEYLDDELPAAERAALEGHLADCAGCRAVLVELGAVVARAGALDERPPREELWSGIAARIGSPVAARRLGGAASERFGGPARRLAFSMPQLAAAAAVLLVVGGSAGWLAGPMLRGGDAVPVVANAPLAPVAPAGPAGPATYGDADPAMAAVVEELEAVLESGRGRLSPSTIRTLEANLAIIDTAIGEAQRAVAGDPGNAYLQTHLADVMRRKVTLLQRAASLASAQT
jgi:anti-sigma factor RsiW